MHDCLHFAGSAEMHHCLHETWVTHKSKFMRSLIYQSLIALKRLYTAQLPTCLGDSGLTQTGLSTTASSGRGRRRNSCVERCVGQLEKTLVMKVQPLIAGRRLVVQAQAACTLQLSCHLFWASLTPRRMCRPQMTTSVSLGAIASESELALTRTSGLVSQKEQAGPWTGKLHLDHSVSQTGS
jgi:hypothetical protein